MNFREALCGNTGNKSQMPTTTWSIDRPKIKTIKASKKIIEQIPDIVAQMVVEEVLTLVGNANWNDPQQVSKTIANIMSINLNQPIEDQLAHPCEIDRTVLVPTSKDSDIPHWICQSIIRVDEKSGSGKNNRFIDYKGAKYNKVDIIYTSDYFKKQMDLVAEAANCTWEFRWGNAREEEHRLYQKTRTGSATGDESWLDRCVQPLLTQDDVDGINIKNLIMFSFKRKKQ